MEGLNALACYVGFDPEENPSFWRSLVIQLTRCSSRAHSLQRLTSGLFSRYDVTTSFHTNLSSNSLACGIAMCLSDDPASPAMDVRRQVHGQLQRYLLSSPPALDVIFGSTHDDGLDARGSEKFLDTINDLPFVRSLEGSGIQKVKVVVGRELAPFPMTAHGRACVLENDCIEVVAFHGTYNADMVEIDSIRALLMSLCKSPVLVTMTWVLNNPPYALLIALYSSLPYMPSLRRLTFRAGTLYDCPDWFAFALKSRQRRGVELALSMAFNENEYAAFIDTMHDDASTFACLIPSDVRAIATFEYFRVGTSAKPVAGAELTQELVVKRTDRRVLHSDGRRLDVLARCRDKCIVVVPAYGLMWVHVKALGAWQHPPAQAPPSLSCGLRSLAYVDCRSSEITRTAYALGACNVSALYEPYGLRGYITAREAAHLETQEAVCLSSLQSLEVPAREVDSLASIGTHPVFGHCKLENLVVNQPHTFKQVTSPSPFLDAVTQRSGPLWHTLRELSVESLDLSIECMEALAAALATNRRLRFVRVRTSVAGEHHESLRQQFAVAVGPTDRSKVSLCRFLLSVRRSGRWQLLPSPCQRLVVAFAAVPARRQVVFLPPRDL